MLEYHKICGLYQTQLNINMPFHKSEKGGQGLRVVYIDTYIISFIFFDNNI